MTATASDEDIERCRQLWIAIAATNLQDLKRRVNATGRRMEFDKQSLVVLGYDAEIRDARDYVYSKDFRFICEQAGISYKPDTVMRWIKKPGSVDDGTIDAVFGLVIDGMSVREASARVGINRNHVADYLKKAQITVAGLREAAQ